jgi:hypothetical protein
MATRDSKVDTTFFEGRGLESLVMAIAKQRRKPDKRSKEVAALYDGAFGPELLAWLDLFDRVALERAQLGDIELRRTHTDGFKALVTNNERAEWVAEFQGFFCGASTIAQDGEMSLMAAWEPSPAGACQVVYAHQDEWGAFHVARSITSYLLEELLKDEAASQRLEGEVARLARDRKAFEKAKLAKGARPDQTLESFHGRTLWLTKAFLGIGEEWSDVLAKAATMTDWKAEKTNLACRPNLAAYWLWSNYLLENDEELDEAMAATRRLRSPVVVESRDLVESLRRGRGIRLGELDAVYFDGVREEIGAAAPKRLLGPARAKRGPKTAVAEANHKAAVAAKGDLLGAIGKDPRGAEALELLKRLETVRASDFIACSRLPLDHEQTIARLGELVDARWVAFLAEKLAAAAKYRDEHKKATPGLIYALACACGSFEEWDKHVKEAGTKNFGVDRQGELAKAYARFEHPKALAWLEEHAGRYVDLMLKDIWQRKVPEDVLRAFLGTRSKAVPAVIARLLEKVELGGQTLGICLLAAARAGELRAPQTLKGLARMVEEGLGYRVLKDRAMVARAYARVAGEAARPLLEKTLAEANGQMWVAMAAVSGLLAIPGGTYAANAGQILDEFRAIKRPDLAQVQALAAVLRGIAADPERTLRELARPFVDIDYTETNETRGTKAAIRRFAAEACG